MTPRKLSLDPPQDDLAVMTEELLGAAVRQSRNAPRGRMVAPLHRSLADPVHRMLNAIQPGSYVRPHRHLEPPKPEALIVLRGRLLFVTFHKDGAIEHHLVLEARSDRFGVDLVPGRYHTVVALVPDTVIYEVKSGPYEATTDKSFAPWAPEERTAEAEAYLNDLLARCGEKLCFTDG
jgi:cupin fold WbuC family metalloprotein